MKTLVGSKVRDKWPGFWGLLGFAALLLVGCNREAQLLAREDLFTLRRGFLPNEVSLVSGSGNHEYMLGQVGISPSASIYLSDPVSRKLMVLSNYGDLLGMIYNPDTNLWSKTSAANNFTAWPFQGIQNFLVTRNRIYLVDEALGQDQPQILIFSSKGEYLYALDQYHEEQTTSMISGLQVDDAGQLVLLRFQEKIWLLDWYTSRGSWQSNQQLNYEQEVGGRIEVISAVRPAFTPRRVYYQKMIYSTEQSDFPGPNSNWSLLANELWLFEVVGSKHTRLFSLTGDYLDASLLGLLSDDRMVMVYYQGGKMIVVPYDRRGQRGKAAALEVSQAPTRFALAPSGLLVSAVYQAETVDLVWWRLDELWNKRRG